MVSGQTEVEVDERPDLGQDEEHGDDSGAEKEQPLGTKPLNNGGGDEGSSGSSSSGDEDDKEEDEEREVEGQEEDSHGNPNGEQNGQFAEENGVKSLALPEKSNPIEFEEAPSQDNVSEGDDKPLATNLIERTPAHRPGRKPAARTAYEVSGPAGSSAAKKQKMTEDDDSGTAEEQAEFLKEVEIFHRERGLDFKPPKFYQEPLNLLKLWRAVIRLGGYDRVTGLKLWRQVGESFHPPKTCTTVSWTFRIFYEKTLQEFEKYKRENGDVEFPDIPQFEPASVEVEGSGYQNAGSGRARRESATRAMQGWHAQRLIGYGEGGEPNVKDKNLSAAQKREKNLKSIGTPKQKKTSALEPVENHNHPEAHNESRILPIASVVDVGTPADWVKVNVRESKDCFEVYALVPGLLREEVRVQSDPAGRLVITGQPDQPDNPWGITAFKKIISLPARINPLQTSAVVSLHGRLFVRVPFDRSSN